jgi:ABC-type multidrug transport system fused ATPase/permease subunit
MLKLITGVVVVERGRVIATGKHADLLENCAPYRRLYHAQADGTAEETQASESPGKAA